MKYSYPPPWHILLSTYYYHGNGKMNKIRHLEIAKGTSSGPDLWIYEIVWVMLRKRFRDGRTTPKPISPFHFVVGDNNRCGEWIIWFTWVDKNERLSWRFICFEIKWMIPLSTGKNYSRNRTWNELRWGINTLSLSVLLPHNLLFGRW